MPSRCRQHQTARMTSADISCVNAITSHPSLRLQTHGVEQRHATISHSTQVEGAIHWNWQTQAMPPAARRGNLSVRFLEARARTAPTELLRLAATGIGDEKRPVVCEQLVLQLFLRGLVHKLLVVRDDAFGDRLADGVDLAGVSTTANAQADVDVGEALRAEDQQRLEDLDAQALGLEQIQRRSVELHQPFPIAGDVRDRDGRFLPAETLDGVLSPGNTHDESARWDEIRIYSSSVQLN
jgi:hypothetical protein